mmetsp:Transcript_43458/g.92349  ORF Transcript_43458/g.92349 Transcript_43458/m.92349 type:complete len:1156 (+) Transcript_43458:1-3468(+)
MRESKEACVERLRALSLNDARKKLYENYTDPSSVPGSWDSQLHSALSAAAAHRDLNKELHFVTEDVLLEDTQSWAGRHFNHFVASHFGKWVSGHIQEADEEGQKRLEGGSAHVTEDWLKQAADGQVTDEDVQSMGANVTEGIKGGDSEEEAEAAKNATRDSVQLVKKHCLEENHDEEKCSQSLNNTAVKAREYHVHNMLWTVKSKLGRFLKCLGFGKDCRDVIPNLSLRAASSNVLVGYGGVEEAIDFSHHDIGYFPFVGAMVGATGGLSATAGFYVGVGWKDPTHSLESVYTEYAMEVDWGLTVPDFPLPEFITSYLGAGVYLCVGTNEWLQPLPHMLTTISYGILAGMNALSFPSWFKQDFVTTYYFYQGGQCYGTHHAFLKGMLLGTGHRYSYFTAYSPLAVVWRIVELVLFKLNEMRRPADFQFICSAGAGWEVPPSPAMKLTNLHRLNVETLERNNDIVVRLQQWKAYEAAWMNEVDHGMTSKEFRRAHIDEFESKKTQLRKRIAQALHPEGVRATRSVPWMKDNWVQGFLRRGLQWSELEEQEYAYICPTNLLGQKCSESWNHHKCGQNAHCVGGSHLKQLGNCVCDIGYCAQKSGEGRYTRFSCELPEIDDVIDFLRHNQTARLKTLDAASVELQESEKCNTAQMAYEMDMQIIRFESDTPDLENHIRSEEDARTVKGFQSDYTGVDIKGWSGTIKGMSAWAYPVLAKNMTFNAQKCLSPRWLQCDSQEVDEQAELDAIAGRIRQLLDEGLDMSMLHSTPDTGVMRCGSQCCRGDGANPCKYRARGYTAGKDQLCESVGGKKFSEQAAARFCESKAYDPEKFRYCQRFTTSEFFCQHYSMRHGHNPYERSTSLANCLATVSVYMFEGILEVASDEVELARSEYCEREGASKTLGAQSHCQKAIQSGDFCRSVCGNKRGRRYNSCRSKCLSRVAMQYRYRLEVWFEDAEAKNELEFFTGIKVSEAPLAGADRCLMLAEVPTKAPALRAAAQQHVCDQKQMDLDKYGECEDALRDFSVNGTDFCEAYCQRHWLNKWKFASCMSHCATEVQDATASLATADTTITQCGSQCCFSAGEGQPCGLAVPGATTEDNCAMPRPPTQEEAAVDAQAELTMESTTVEPAGDEDHDEAALRPGGEWVLDAEDIEMPPQ